MAKSTKTIVSTDEKVLALFEVVKQKKAEIEQAERPNFSTNCSFGYTEDSAQNRINLQVVSDPKVLVSILGFLREKENHFAHAANELGLAGTKFTWMGYSIEDWKSDIVTRLNKIQIKKKKDELELLESKLNALVSPELKAKLELAEIEKALTK